MIKRERSNNFIDSEVDLLIELVDKYKETIECKKTDAVMWKEKEAAWNNIEKEFNILSGQFPRTVKNLKIKYDGLKKTVKKKATFNQSEIYKTGGGVPKHINFNSNEEKLLAFMKVSATGSQPRFDSDNCTYDLNFITNYH